MEIFALIERKAKFILFFPSYSYSYKRESEIVEFPNLVTFSPQAGDIRRRLSESVNAPKSKSGFKRDPEDPSASVLKEPWQEKVNTMSNTKQDFYSEFRWRELESPVHTVTSRAGS